MVCTLFQHCALPFLRRYLFYEKAPRVKCFAYMLLCWFAWQWLHKHVFCTQHVHYDGRWRVASRNAASGRRNIAKIWKLLCYMRPRIWNLFPLLCVAPVNYTPRQGKQSGRHLILIQITHFLFLRDVYFSAIFSSLDGRICVCCTTQPNFPPCSWAANTFPEKYRTHANITRAQQHFFFKWMWGVLPSFPAFECWMEGWMELSAFARQRSLSLSMVSQKSSAEALFALCTHTNT